MKKITIGVFTTSRSEFGILLTLINKFKKSNRISLKVFAGGSHFLKSCGKTIKEIQNILDKKIKTLLPVTKDKKNMYYNVYIINYYPI